MFANWEFKVLNQIICYMLDCKNILGGLNAYVRDIEKGIFPEL